MDINTFYNADTLNIFCDASMRKRGNAQDGCYGAIALCGDTLVDKLIRINSNTTNNNCEIKAIKAGVILGIRHGGMFKMVNVFSDSQISIFGIRDRLYGWNCYNGVLYGSSNQPVSSQDIYIEIMMLMIEYSQIINFWHQKGHVSNSGKTLNEALHTFLSSNRIRDPVDINLIRYISKYNDRIDNETRSVLYQTDIYKKQIKHPLEFQINSNGDFASMINLYDENLGYMKR